MRSFYSIAIVTFCVIIGSNAAPNRTAYNPLSDEQMMNLRVGDYCYAEGDLDMIQQSLRRSSIQSDNQVTDELPKSQPTTRPHIGFEGVAQPSHYEIVTEDKLEYQFAPVTSGQIKFRIKAANDAHIALTAGPEEKNPMYEIFIGGWSNSKSVIRKNREKPDVAEVATPGILSTDEFRGFWIKWHEGHIDVGREGESTPFLSYKDSERIRIGYFGVCTGWGAHGRWIIEGPDTAAPSTLAGSWTPRLCWRNASAGGLPIGAVVGGHDGESLYIGRAYHERALTPGKVHPTHGVCYVAWGGKEHAKGEYQVLCDCNPKWVRASGGNVPPNAVVGGKSQDGELLFIGRVNHEGTLTVGKVQKSYNALFIPYAGNEIAFYNEYEVLVNESGPSAE